MKNITADKKLIAKCGLYCGACSKFLKSSCPGCQDNIKATWCKVRSCCLEHSYGSCAECSSYAQAVECGKFNNFIARIFGFIFRSDRNACIERIKELGPESYAREMTEQQKQTIKK